jgi:hypothetical protein
MSTRIPRRELPNGKIWVPCCPECTAIAEHWGWPNWCPDKGGVHEPGQPMWRDDTFHEADCPHLRDFESGFAPLAGHLILRPLHPDTLVGCVARQHNPAGATSRR